MYQKGSLFRYFNAHEAQKCVKSGTGKLDGVRDIHKEDLITFEEGLIAFAASPDLVRG